MDTSVVVATITGLVTLLSPMLVKSIERNSRDEIDKEIKILKQLNPESDAYALLSEHIEKTLRDFAENDWLRSQYRNAYRRYVIFFLLLAVLYLLNSWTDSFEQAPWYMAYQILRAVLYLLATAIGGSILAPLIAALFSEFKQIRIEWELKRRKFHADQLEKLADRMEGSRQEMERELEDLRKTHSVPANEEEEYAKLYNLALWWGLRGAVREQVVEALVDAPVLHGADANKAVNDAFDYFDEWAKKNEILKFIDDSHGSF